MRETDSEKDMNRVREERDELVNQLATAQAAVVSLTEKHAQGRDELKLLKQYTDRLGKKRNKNQNETKNKLKRKKAK